MRGTAEERLAKRQKQILENAEKGRILKTFGGVSLVTIRILNSERKKRGESMAAFIHRLARASAREAI